MVKLSRPKPTAKNGLIGKGRPYEGGGKVGKKKKA